MVDRATGARSTTPVARTGDSALLGGPSGTPRRLPQATQPQAPLQGECTPSWKVRRGHAGISSELKVHKALQIKLHETHPHPDVRLGWRPALQHIEVHLRVGF